MTDYVISCDTFARLASLTTSQYDDGFKAIRLDGGLAVACNRQLLAVEKIGGEGPIIHIIPDEALLQQCRQEAPHKSNLTITVVEVLGYATCKTTFGYVHPTNILLPPGAYEIDRWREIVAKSAVPADKSNGCLYMHLGDQQKLAQTAPSGQVVFEEIVDVNRPVVVRDPYEPNWCGFFYPFPRTEDFPPATYPSWLS